MAEPPPPFDAVLERMYERKGVDGLPAHLERTYGMAVTKVHQLDVGVVRVDRGGGAPVVARVFSASRGHAAAAGDLAVLEYLAEVGFPAERALRADPLSSYEGQAVLVTDFIRQVPKAKRPAYPILRLGRMIGRLHQLPVPAGADRPAGALHHFAAGTMADELRAATGWLDAIQSGMAPADRAARRPLHRRRRRRAAGGVRASRPGSQERDLHG